LLSFSVGDGWVSPNQATLRIDPGAQNEALWFDSYKASLWTPGGGGKERGEGKKGTAWRNRGQQGVGTQEAKGIACLLVKMVVDPRQNVKRG